MLQVDLLGFENNTKKKQRIKYCSTASHLDALVLSRLKFKPSLIAVVISFLTLYYMPTCTCAHSFVLAACGQDFHECVADRVNSDNKNRAKYLESLFEKRVPTKQRSPANPLRKPQMPKAVTPMATNFLRDFSMRASSIDEAKLSPSNSLSQRGQQAEERRVSLQPLQEAEDIQGDKAALRSPKNSNRSSETPTLERTSSNRCESTKKEADSIVDTPLATSCGNAPNTRRPSCKLSYLEGFESGCVSPLGGSSPVPSAKPAKTRRASVAEMMGKASRPKTPIVNQLPFPPDRNQEPCSGGGLISHRSSNSGVASSEVKLKPLGGERHKLQDAVLAAVAPTRKGAIEKVCAYFYLDGVFFESEPNIYEMSPFSMYARAICLLPDV